MISNSRTTISSSGAARAPAIASSRANRGPSSQAAASSMMTSAGAGAKLAVTGPASSANSSIRGNRLDHSMPMPSLSIRTTNDGTVHSFRLISTGAKGASAIAVRINAPLRLILTRRASIKLLARHRSRTGMSTEVRVPHRCSISGSLQHSVPLIDLAIYNSSVRARLYEFEHKDHDNEHLVGWHCRASRIDLRPFRCRKEPLQFFPDSTVAFACRIVEPRLVRDSYATTRVPNQVGLLQETRGNRYAGALNAQHHR